MSLPFPFNMPIVIAVVQLMFYLYNFAWYVIIEFIYKIFNVINIFKGHMT